MVTPHGGPPLDTPSPSDDIVHRHRVPPPHLTLNNNINNNTSGSNDRHNLTPNPALSPTSPAKPTKYIPYSPRLARPSLDQLSYNTETSLHNTPSRNEELYFNTPVSDPMSSRHDIPIASSPPAKTSRFPNKHEEQEQEAAWPLPMTDAAQSINSVPRMRPTRTGLRISMSTSSLNGRRRSPHPDRQYADMSAASRPLPRFPPRVTPDLMQYNDPLRSSQTSGQTSYSSFEQMSGTERSSIATKTSSITDMSPDTPNGYFGEDEDMTVEDAIGMYLDDIIDLPEDSTSTHSVPPGGELDVIAENIYSPTKRTSVASLNPGPEVPVMEKQEVLSGHNQSPSHDQSVDELETKDEQKTADDSNEQFEQRQEVEASRSTGSSQPTVEPVGPADNETASPKSTGSRQQSSKNLSINVSATLKMDTTKAVNQPIPSPRYSTVVRVAGKVPPSFLPGTDDRDRYGFRKVTHHVSREQFEAWHKPYAASAEHRRLKWVKLMESSGLPTECPVTFPPKSNVLKRFVRKGIPSEYRGAAWFYYAGGYQHMHPNPGHYAKLVQEAMSSSINTDKEHIERDLYRTFPDNVHFKPEMSADLAGIDTAGSDIPKHSSVIIETQMIRSLRRVLYAFALHNPRIGYTQSLNFIAGMLLLFLPEEKAFWMLHIITTELFPGTHEISLEGANVDMWILMVLLRDNLPHVYTKLVTTTPTTAKGKAPALTVNTRLPDITLGLTNWLMSMFIGSLPLETTLRVWDCFFYEGSKTFFRVALGIFKAGEREILSVSDPMEVFQIVQTIPKKLLDANALMEESLSRKYRMGQARIDLLRDQRREAVRQEKTRLSLFTSKGLGQDRPATRTGARSPIPRLDGWRAIKKNTFN
ncbi:GTPase activating protein (Gyp3), putative [Talaromyces stipitatus ATCC 10500]|uniref:GTPase activating protein (Gyp3), putative n=1 Tax=Talaromyces stipitatus (strain ATCC 10500 / CBS 375.48 / QM 6759 / NRRL 1006) TaxID=441959 RepID=B8M5K3_TALSN|nr:GTPase activating protein (Gyp3), putative [Talaromyces stipitatus ATCC 10500]EED19897.1 GTPase activating protein (Gyp3), putative [Talaromyces stipitatus ATCC 10500]